MNLSKCEAFFLDFDGVVLESATLKTDAFRELFVDRFPKKVDEIVKYHICNMGISRFVKFDYIYNNIVGVPITEELKKKLGEDFSQIALEKILQAPFVVGIENFLKTCLVNNKRIFIASGTPQEELEYIIEKRNLQEFFTEIHGSPQTKEMIVEDIVARFKLNKRKCLFIGDALSDMQAAEKTGLIFLARLTKEDNKLRKCKYTMDDFLAIKKLLNKIEEDFNND